VQRTEEGSTEKEMSTEVTETEGTGLMAISLEGLIEKGKERGPWNVQWTGFTTAGLQLLQAFEEEVWVECLLGHTPISKVNEEVLLAEDLEDLLTFLQEERLTEQRLALSSCVFSLLSVNITSMCSLCSVTHFTVSQDLRMVKYQREKLPSTPGIKLSRKKD
jgi:hypothetical protein